MPCLTSSVPVGREPVKHRVQYRSRTDLRRVAAYVSHWREPHMEHTTGWAGTVMPYDLPGRPRVCNAES